MKHTFDLSDFQIEEQLIFGVSIFFISIFCSQFKVNSINSLFLKNYSDTSPVFDSYIKSSHLKV